MAVAIGLALAALTANPLTPLPEAVHPMQLRLHEALAPGHGRLGAAITAVLGTELLFRGWLQERAGWMRSTAAGIAVCCPFDPVLGLVSGIGLGALTHRSGSVGPALLAHAVWAVL